MELTSGLEFLRTLIEWSIKHASSQEQSKPKKALWLVGVEAKTAEHINVQLEGTVVSSQLLFAPLLTVILVAIDSPLLNAISERLSTLIEVLKHHNEVFTPS